MVYSSPPLADIHRLPALRQQFPALANKQYFNYGGQGPLPQVALEAVYQAHQKLQTEGPFSSATKDWLEAEGRLTRQALAEQLQVPTETMTLTENVTVGCNIPLWGIDWQVGDRIVITDCEHPGIVAAVQEISRRFRVKVEVCPLLATAQGGDPIEVVTAALRPRTRLLVISHILWNTGQLLPLTEIVRACHAHTPEPVRVLVDAAQSVGMMPLNLTETGVDFYAFTGHKWCCGPAGLGGLYVHPAVRDTIAPTFIGWRGITIGAHAAPTGWEPSSKRYEVATSDYPLMSSLRAALQFHEQWGTPRDRFRRICQLSYHFWQRLQSHPRIHMVAATPPQSGLISFQLLTPAHTPSPPLHTQLVKDLEANHQYLRILLHPHCVRACVHYFTLESEVDTLADQIVQWIATR